MTNWRARNIKELAVRPYSDPVAFYGFWFSIVIGIMGTLGLAAAFIQAYASMKALSPLPS